MRKIPLVSVIIPCYNCDSYVEEAINSIVNQTYSNLEILIVDDCSSDNTGSILDEFEKKDKRIKVIHHSENKRIVFSLNEMLDIVSGDYIARMDSDDVSILTRIEKQVNFLEQNLDYSLCGVNAEYIDDKGKIKSNIDTVMPLSDEDIKFFLRFGNYIIHPGVMIRRQAIENERYDSSFLYAEDYELWCRLLIKNKNKVTNLEENLLKYRVYSEQTSSKNARIQINKSADIIAKYKIVEDDIIEIHNNVFFLRNRKCERKDKNYILSVFKQLSKKDYRYSYLIIARICYFLILNKEFLLLIRLLFSRIGFYSAFKILKLKIG